MCKCRDWLNLHWFLQKRNSWTVLRFCTKKKKDPNEKKKKASFNNKAESKQPKIGRTEDAGRVKSEYTEEKSKLN